MALDSVRTLPVGAPLRDEFDDIKSQGFRKYVSPWVRIDASGSYGFSHGLKEIPHVVSVLVATDSQGSNEQEASALSVVKTGTIVTVTNSGDPRFFRVRAF